MSRIKAIRNTSCLSLRISEGEFMRKRKGITIHYFWEMMIFLVVILLILGVSKDEQRSLLPVFSDSDADVTPVSSFNVSEYMGLWYEVGRYPNRFEADCLCATAEYTLLSDSVLVNNTCFKEGDTSFIEGRAFLTSVPGVLEVQFFPLIKADYRVLFVDDDYDIAVVSDFRAKNLWLLSRDPYVDTEGLVNIVSEKGFDVERIIFNKMGYCG